MNTNLKSIYHKVDLCVVGGGLAGMCAAVAAARHGIKVALMHDRQLESIKKRRTKPCGIFSLRNSAYYKPKPCFGRIGKVGRGKSAYRT